MSRFPHCYSTQSSAQSTSLLTTSSRDKQDIVVSPPSQFGGPEGYWTPEDFYSASISSCFILTFRFIARTQNVSWDNIIVNVDTFLDKTNCGLMFTKVDISVDLTIKDLGQKALAEKLLEQAKKDCLITKSLHPDTQITVLAKIN